jgi:hypothetical protein
MALVTLDEHEKQIQIQVQNKYKTGIQCPKCANELQWIDDLLYMSYPPKRDYKCYTCGETGCTTVSHT